MNVTREVIIDLLPVYLAGDASPATRSLVEDYLKQDTELARRIRLQCAENLAAAVPPALPPELELRTLRRTRSLLVWQRWLFGFGIFFTLTGFSNSFSVEGGRFKDFHFLLRDYPAPFGMSLAIGVVCWLIYSYLRHRLRTTGL